MYFTGFCTYYCKRFAAPARVAAGCVLAVFAALLWVAPVARAAPAGVFPDKYAAIVLDAGSGAVMFADKADMRRYPASLTKMMTLYLLFDAIKAGRLGLDTPLPISAYANSRPPTKLNLGAGQTISAEAAAKALITKSANDIAVAIAEYLGGTERNFTRMMNLKARQLAMRNTHFANASGLPDLQNYSTARDLAVLALALQRHFPEQYRLFSTTNFIHRGRLIRGHNRLVATMAGVDGIKTGYTRMSGFNLASSRHIGNKSIIAIVMGGKTSALRDSYMAGLLTRYLDKAGSRKRFSLPPISAEPPVLMAAAQAGGRAAAVIPVPMAKAAVAGSEAAEILAASAAGAAEDMPAARPAVMSDRERDSALLMILASQSGAHRNRPASAIPVSAFVAETPLPAAEKAERPLDHVITAALPAADYGSHGKKGWVIQLAAGRSPHEAKQILRKAAETMAKIHASAVPYTEKFTKGGIAYYRARFSGFASKAAARQSCARMKIHGYNCIAVAK